MEEDKRKILERNKENPPKDEWAAFIEAKAQKFGLIGMSCIFLIVFVINLAFYHDLSFDILSLLWGYLAIHYGVSFSVHRTRTSLLVAILCTISAICFFITYILWKVENLTF